MTSTPAEDPVITQPLVDRYGRVHTYLRVSVTDRCNLRCVYCLPEEGMSQVPRDDLLSYEEIARLAGVFAQAGVSKLRLTGGEPTVRRGIDRLVAAVAAVDGITDVAMTTNGHTLPHLARRLARAGLRRVNVSLDTLRAERFAELTRGGRLDRVLDGIRAAREAGLHPIKINAVLMRGMNDDELFDLVDYLAPDARTTALRFIEYMPFEVRRYDSIPAHRIRERLAERYTLLPASSGGAAAGPGRAWTLAENGLQVGFISPLSQHFCATCNRLRLLANGHLRTCLAHDRTPSLRDLIRDGATDADLDQAIRTMVLGKPEGHSCEVGGGRLFEGVMTRIGG